MHEEGSLIVTDFSKNPAKFQKALVGLMYLLFNSVGATERSKLPEFYALFAAEQLSIFKEKKLGLGPYQDLVLTFQLTVC